MAVSFVQEVNANTGNNATPTLAGVSAGNLLVAVIGLEGDNGGGDSIDITDDNGNSWTIVSKTHNTNTGGGVFELEALVAYVLSANAGNTTVTLSYNGSGSRVETSIMEFSTTAPEFIFVGSSGSFGNGTAADSGAVSGSGELAVGATADWSSSQSLSNPEIPDGVTATETYSSSLFIAGYRIAALTNPEFTSDETSAQEWVSVIGLFTDPAAVIALKNTHGFGFGFLE